MRNLRKKWSVFFWKRDFTSPLNSLLQIWIWRSCFVLMVLSLLSKIWHFDKLGQFLKKWPTRSAGARCYPMPPWGHQLQGGLTTVGATMIRLSLRWNHLMFFTYFFTNLLRTNTYSGGVHDKVDFLSSTRKPLLILCKSTETISGNFSNLRYLHGCGDNSLTFAWLKVVKW